MELHPARGLRCVRGTISAMLFGAVEDNLGYAASTGASVVGR
jgi:hypothetical protein